MINEPMYGFTKPLTKEGREALAQALEAVRRRICGYNPAGFTDRWDQDSYCDCKYGLSIDKLVSGEQKVNMGSEQTGCPELRSVIYWLLHDGEEMQEDITPDFLIPLLDK